MEFVVFTSKIKQKWLRTVSKIRIKNILLGRFFIFSWEGGFCKFPTRAFRYKFLTHFFKSWKKDLSFCRNLNPFSGKWNLDHIFRPSWLCTCRLKAIDTLIIVKFVYLFKSLFVSERGTRVTNGKDLSWI